MTAHINTFIAFEDDREVKVSVTYHFTSARPAKMYLRNGDPGYPEEPAGVEVLKIEDDAGNMYDYDNLSDGDKDRIREECLEDAIERGGNEL